MAYNELLADRMAQTLREIGINYTEKKMFGGMTFMVDDKMCVGVIKDDMMLRIDPKDVEESMKRPGCKLMDFTGRPMKGYLMIQPEAYDMDEDLTYWIKLAVAFNPSAKASKKGKNK